MARQLKITVDYNVCVGNAMCETFAENTFGLNDDRQSYVKDPAGDPRKPSSKPRRTARSRRSPWRTRRPERSCSRSAPTLHQAKGANCNSPLLFGQ